MWLNSLTETVCPARHWKAWAPRSWGLSKSKSSFMLLHHFLSLEVFLPVQFIYFYFLMPIRYSLSLTQITIPMHLPCTFLSICVFVNSTCVCLFFLMVFGINYIVSFFFFSFNITFKSLSWLFSKQVVQCLYLLLCVLHGSWYIDRGSTSGSSTTVLQG